MNKNTRKIITAVLSAAMLTMPVTGLAANTVSFRDVSTTAWYYADIQTASELGIINGKGDNLFDPQGNLSVAEAIKLTACARAYYEGESEELDKAESDGTHWASKYIAYAVENGIIDSVTDTKKLDTVITRDEMAKMFAKALPDTEYGVINAVSDMPDKNVPDYVEKLFKSGIMLGDSDGFRLGDTITRAETACIINRVLLSEKRQTAEKPVTAVVNSDKGKLHIDNINDMLAQIGGSSGNNNNSTSTTAKYTLQKDPATGKYIPFNDPAMAEYNRPAMVEFIYGAIQDNWHEGYKGNYKALYTVGVDYMSEEFGGIDLNNPNRGGGMYSKDDFNKLSAGDYLVIPDWLGAHMLVAERLDNAIVVVTPTATTFRWKVYTWEQLDVIRQKSDSNSLGSEHIEFNEL